VGPDPDFTAQKFYFMQITSQNPHEFGDIFIFAVKLKLSPPHHGTCLNKGFFEFGRSGPGLHRTEILFYENHLGKSPQVQKNYYSAVNSKLGPLRYLFKHGILFILILLFGSGRSGSGFSPHRNFISCKSPRKISSRSGICLFLQ